MSHYNKFHLWGVFLFGVALCNLGYAFTIDSWVREALVYFSILLIGISDLLYSNIGSGIVGGKNETH